MLNQRIINHNKVEFGPFTLYHGDNLDVLRDCPFPKECIDLIYLDPPFNSKADYNVLFKEKGGEESTAQIQAFTDFWHWDTQALHAYSYLIHEAPNEAVGKLVLALNTFLGKSDMLAYVVMMGERLLELHRVLKPTGSIFLHCDSTASHYLKLLLDAIFGASNFHNEIVWQRQTAHSDAKRRFGRVSDRILFYSKTSNYKFNRVAIPHKKSHIESKYNQMDENGRKFSLGDLNPPHGRGPIYEYHGMIRPWRFTKEKMLRLEKEGRIYTGWKIPRLKRYLDESEVRGAAVQEIWSDIAPVNSQARERLGFETQKPIALLERIIRACTDEDDLILDPFCGCGTAIVAAEKLRRRWIGIDITMLAIGLVNRRIKDMFPDAQVRIDGVPTDMQSAIEFALRDRHKFQQWAVLKIDARPVGSTPSDPKRVKKGADEGYDGWLRFQDGYEGNVERILVQVKSGHVSVVDIRHFRDVITTKGAAMGVFITLQEPTRDMIEAVKTTDPYVSRNLRIEYPRIQIVTVDQLLRRQGPKLPPTVPAFEEALATTRVSKYTNSKLM